MLNNNDFGPIRDVLGRLYDELHGHSPGLSDGRLSGDNSAPPPGLNPDSFQIRQPNNLRPPPPFGLGGLDGNGFSGLGQ